MIEKAEPNFKRREKERANKEKAGKARIAEEIRRSAELKKAEEKRENGR